MTPPDFIIAGAMRSATTALAQALAEHPAVFMSQPKEPSYFAVPRGALDFCGPGDRWFAAQHAVDWDSYQALFDGSGNAVAGEASAMYLAIPGVAREIAGRRPEAKIVVVLRDPVARAHSAWLYLRTHGREGLDDFAAALAAEDGRRSSGYGPMWWYVGASRYNQGLAEFYDAFPADAILALTTEELRASPSGTMARVCRFLGIDHEGWVPQALEQEVNAAGAPRAEWLARALYPADGLRRIASRAAPPPVRRWVRTARASAVRAAEPMPEACRHLLLAQLADVPADVAHLTGIDVSSWSMGSANTQGD